MDYLLLSVAVIGLILCGKGIVYCNKKAKYYKGLLKRNSDVCAFRTMVLYNYPEDVYDSMPSYDYMLYDNKELTIENYCKYPLIL